MYGIVICDSTDINQRIHIMTKLKPVVTTKIKSQYNPPFLIRLLVLVDGNQQGYIQFKAGYMCECKVAPGFEDLHLYKVLLDAVFKNTGLTSVSICTIPSQMAMELKGEYDTIPSGVKLSKRVTWDAYIKPWEVSVRGGSGDLKGVDASGQHLKNRRKVRIEREDDVTSQSGSTLIQAHRDEMSRYKLELFENYTLDMIEYYVKYGIDNSTELLPNKIREFEHITNIIAFLDEEPIGIIRFGVWQGSEDNPTGVTGVSVFYVDPKYRGNNIGKALLKEVHSIVASEAFSKDVVMWCNPREDLRLWGDLGYTVIASESTLIPAKLKIPHLDRVDEALCWDNVLKGE